MAAYNLPFDIETMLEQVDRALYAAKRVGRDRTVVYAGGERDGNDGLILAA